jgi:hypothetical protein
VGCARWRWAARYDGPLMFAIQNGRALMWHDGMPGWGMGHSWMAVLIWILVLLVIAALVKYLFFSKRDK